MLGGFASRRLQIWEEIWLEPYCVLQEGGCLSVATHPWLLVLEARYPFGQWHPEQLQVTAEEEVQIGISMPQNLDSRVTGNSSFPKRSINQATCRLVCSSLQRSTQLESKPVESET